jgi:hypothetical protein
MAHMATIQTVPKPERWYQLLRMANPNAKMISIKELCERRMLLRLMRGCASWAQWKMGMWDVDTQFMEVGDIYQLVIRVRYKPLPETPLIDYSNDTRQGPT